MIPISFDYYKAEDMIEANNLYNNISSENKNVYYYAGGSEIITMSRAGSILPDAIIDLKGIGTLQDLKIKDNKLYIGAMVSLSKISESKMFPLLGTTVARIADHTNQNRITVGGNICGTIIYREAVLPLLLTDANVSIFSHGKENEVPINSVFNKQINLQKGEYVTKFIVDEKYLNLPYIHVKKTKGEKIDYPLLTVCAIKYEGKIRIAFSGLLNYPFRSLEIEDILNDSSLTNDMKINKVLENLPEVPPATLLGSTEYKGFVLRNTLEDILNTKEFMNV